MLSTPGGNYIGKNTSEYLESKHYDLANTDLSPCPRATQHCRRWWVTPRAAPTKAYPDQTAARKPLTNEDGSLALAVNGEIYNHRVVRKQLKTAYPFKTHSDCEVIIPLVRVASVQEDHN